MDRTSVIAAFIFCLLSFAGISGHARAGDGLEGIDLLEQAKTDIFDGINLARSDPWGAVEALEFDSMAIMKSMSSVEVDRWVAGLWPLVFNSILGKIAQAHCEDMLLRSFYGHDSPEGIGPEDRLAATDYQGEYRGEILGAVSFRSIMTVEEGVQVLMDFLLAEALMKIGDSECLLAEGPMEIGIGLSAGPMQSGGQRLNAYVLCLVLASPSSGFQCGYICMDENNNNIYDAGEEAGDAELKTNSSGVVMARTNFRGAYCMRPPDDWWTIELHGLLIRHEPPADKWPPPGGVLRRDYLMGWQDIPW